MVNNTNLIRVRKEVKIKGELKYWEGGGGGTPQRAA